MKPRRVVVLAYPDVELLDVAGPVNVLTAASRLARASATYDICLAAEARGAVPTAGGLGLHATHTFRSLRGAIDTLIVPGAIGALEAGRDIVPVVRRLAPRARRVVGVCTGVMLLAEAELLGQRRAVTHWAACEWLRDHYPQCHVEEDAIYVRDGDVWTSAGVTAGMDLALALVEQDHGADLALEVARWLVMYLRRPGGQSQFSAPLQASAARDQPIRALCTWIPEHLDADLSVPALARRAGMSARNFARVFASETGTTPAAWVQRVRVEAARGSLETTTESVKEIAAACGFRNAATMHRAFQRTLGATPLEYRQRFSTV